MTAVSVGMMISNSSRDRTRQFFSDRHDVRPLSGACPVAALCAEAPPRPAPLARAAPGPLPLARAAPGPLPAARAAPGRLPPARAPAGTPPPWAAPPGLLAARPTVRTLLSRDGTVSEPLTCRPRLWAMRSRHDALPTWGTSQRATLHWVQSVTATQL